MENSVRNSCLNDVSFFHCCFYNIHKSHPACFTSDTNVQTSISQEPRYDVKIGSCLGNGTATSPTALQDKNIPISQV